MMGISIKRYMSHSKWFQPNYIPHFFRKKVFFGPGEMEKQIWKQQINVPKTLPKWETKGKSDKI